MTKTDKKAADMTATKYKAIDLLLQGKSDREVAEEIGVARQTVTNWRNRNVYFRAEYNVALQAMRDAGASKAQKLHTLALDILLEELEKTKSPDLALEILNRARIKPIEERIPQSESDAVLMISNVATKKSLDEMDIFNNGPSTEEIMKALENDPFNELEQIKI